MKDLDDVFAKGVINQGLSGKITNAVAASRLGISVRYVKKLETRLRASPSSSLAHGNKRREPADKAFKEQIERKGGMPYKPGPNHPWKRFVVNYKYKSRELGKKGVSDDRG